MQLEYILLSGCCKFIKFFGKTETKKKNIQEGNSTLELKREDLSRSGRRQILIELQIKWKTYAERNKNKKEGQQSTVKKEEIGG